MSKHFWSLLFLGFISLLAAARSNSAPVIVGCPDNLTPVNISNSCTRTVNWDEPTATDSNLPIIVIKSHSPNLSEFEVGTTTVTYTFINSLNQVSTCSFDVTVKYQFFDLPSNQSITVGASCNRTALWVPPSDCGGNVILAYSTSPQTDLNSGDNFPVGETTVTYVALRNGTILDDFETFTITVVDNIAPTFDITPGNVIAAANSNCEAVVNWSVPTVLDNCTTGIVPTSPISPGDTFPLGTTMVTYSAQDEAGNAAIYSFNVTVEDQTAPEFTNLPDDITVTADAVNCQTTATWATVQATDNCSSPVMINETHASGSVFGLGATEVTYTATDDEGNQNIKSFNIIVVDGTPPALISCANDINLIAANSCTATATWTDPTFSDSCDATLSITSSHASGNSFPIGTTTVTVTATDDAGNEVSCSFDVTVTDEAPPVFNSCPTDITVLADAECSAIATWSIPSVSDNCTSDITPTADFSSGDTFPLGTTEVIYTAVDQAGNDVTCSFNVIVIDQTNPVFRGCPADIEIAADDTCSAIVTWTSPTASDNCDSNLTIMESHSSGDSFAFGTTMVTYTATDEAGNATTCTFNVTVVDVTGPEITNCPSDVEISTAACEAIAIWDEILANDNCGNVSTTSNFSSGDTFPLGSTLVTYAFTDDQGNESQCSFNVIVVNPDALVLSDCPEDITVETDDSGIVEVIWTEPSAVSSCSDVAISQSHQSGDTFEVGTTLVTYEFTDEFQTIVTCSFNVTVRIRDIEFDIPKLLTPNNDGNNDIWLLSGLENFPDNEVVIVDRWGSEIFKQSGYDNQRIVWDGSNQNGKIVPTGTYFYYILVKTNSSTQKKQGFIELVQ